jgi:two-component system, chemotaxis family, chemotaxis protein CheY
MKVLVSDDSNTMRRIIVKMIQELGLTDVFQAADGLQAVDAAKKEEFGLALMDWNMPGMTGIDALKSIRALGMRFPVIMVTTEAEKERIMEALKAGASDYIIKPFTQDLLVTKISKVLARSSQAGATA